MHFVKYALCVALLTLGACGSGTNTTTDKNPIQKPQVQPVQAPPFNPDSAYTYVLQQLAFGPRVAGTPAHTRCADWLQRELTRRGATVLQQQWPETLPFGKVTGRNIVAQFYPQHTRRILLSAHYDTRHIADRDANAANKTKPVPGANDGASGVAVLLEVARVLQSKDPGIGVDIMLWDLEDYGESARGDESWCLGSRYWAQNPLPKKYRAEFGILLDMVGAEGAQFTQEETSRKYAGPILTQVWQTAHRLGYGGYFLFAPDTEIMDDHVPLNETAGIPTIDIIHRNLEGGDFFAHHHRMSDDINQIRKETLQAVGHTVVEVIYQTGAVKK